jgi:leader peptidase (prepilin peptidase)/N-methyltransferase
METLTLLCVAAAGLVFGSFFNVVIYRLPRDMSLAYPPSSCPSCKTQIKPYDNIPVLSYFILRGKCRKCGQRISPIYPAVEALTAVGFVLVFVNAGRVISLEFIAGCVFTSVLIVLGLIDAQHQILPDEITVPGLVLALAYAFFRNDLPFRDALLVFDFPWLKGAALGSGRPFREALVGAILGAGFLLLVYGAYYLVRKKEGMGMGDVTMMLMVGATVGPWRTLLVLILGSFFGALIGIVFMIRHGKKSLQFAVPFGTFLAPAAFVAMLWGEGIVRAYLNLFRR